jgi:hypothetical protein
MFCVTGRFWWHCQIFSPWIWAAVFTQTITSEAKLIGFQILAGIGVGLEMQKSLFTVH